MHRVVFPDVVLRISRQAKGHIHVRVAARVTSRDQGFDYWLDLADDTGRVIGTLAPAQDDPMHQVLVELFKLAEQYVQVNVHESGIDKALDYLKRS